MKIIVPLTILIVSFLIYYLFAPSSPKIDGNKDALSSIPIELDTSWQKKVEVTSTPLELDTTWQKEEESAKNNNVVLDIPIADTVRVQPIQKPKKAPKSSREYMTLNDLKTANYEAEIKEEKVKHTTYNEHVFNHLKLILQQSSSTYYAKKHIVLNSRISSILNSNAARSKFRDLISADFGLDYETIDDNLRKNRLVWDWVTFLSP